MYNTAIGRQYDLGVRKCIAIACVTTAHLHAALFQKVTHP